MNYWQLMNGDKGRDYSDVCFDFGIACAGPGWPGEYPQNKDYYDNELKEGYKMEPFTRMVAGDIIVLKNGQTEIVGIGEVLEFNNQIYNYSEVFDDVDGWDLNHFVKVKWKEVYYQFDSRVLTRTTLQGISSEKVIEKVNELYQSSSYNFITPKYSIESLTNSIFTYEELSKHLINKGHKISISEDIANTVRRNELLGNWYLNDSQTPRDNISEDEIRCHLVVPFLLSLGYSQQQIAVESRKKDILVFKTADRTDPHILIETKKFYIGTKDAFIQAKNYASEYSSIEKIVVTDGIRYTVFIKDKDEFNLHSYFNLRNKKLQYDHLPDKGGMIHAILELMRLAST